MKAAQTKSFYLLSAKNHLIMRTRHPTRKSDGAFVSPLGSHTPMSFITGILLSRGEEAYDTGMGTISPWPFCQQCILNFKITVTEHQPPPPEIQIAMTWQPPPLELWRDMTLTRCGNASIWHHQSLRWIQSQLNRGSPLYGFVAN